MNPGDGKTLSFNNTRDTNLHKFLEETRSNNQHGHGTGLAQLINHNSVLDNPHLFSKTGESNQYKQLLLTQVLDGALKTSTAKPSIVTSPASEYNDNAFSSRK